jgi:hypothetical protein
MARRPPVDITPERQAAVAQVSTEIAAAWKAVCAAQVALLHGIRQYAELEGPAVDNMPNVAATLILLLGCSSGTAHGLAAQAGVIDADGVADALAGGEVTPDHLTILARRGGVTPERLEQAKAMDATDLASELRRDAKPTPDDERAIHERRYCRARRLPDTGEIVGTFRLPPAAGETVIRALERDAQRQGVNPQTGQYETLGRQLADALVNLASAKLGADSDPDRATVSVYTEPGFDSATFADGSPVGSMTLQRLLCDCRLECVLVSEPGEPYRFSMVKRLACPAQVRALRKRQRGECATPGCHRKHFLHAHHLKHWTNGGPTILANMVLLCRACHARFHEGGWTMTGTPDHLVIHKPDGTRWHPPWRGLNTDD